MQLIAQLLHSGFHHDNRLYTRTGCAGCVHIIAIHVHAGYDFCGQFILICVHLLRCGLGDTEQEGFTIGCIVAVLVQVVVFLHILQRKALRPAFVIALIALAVHEERTGRYVVRTDEDLIAAHERSGRCRHRQHHVVLSVYFLFCKYTRVYNTLRQIY